MQKNIWSSKLKLMKCFLLIVLLNIPLITTASENLVEQKKILIISSKGGNGHVIAAKILTSKLESNYLLRTIYPFDEVDSLYNYLLSHDMYWIINFGNNYIDPIFLRLSKNKIKSRVKLYVEDYNPNLIVSVIPSFDEAICEVAKEKNIPFLLVTLDNDLTHWVRGFENLSYQNFQVTIGNELKISKGLLLAKGFPEEFIKTTGFPLRQDFLEKKNKEAIKEFFAVPEGKNVVLLMMGGAGSKRAIDYAKRALLINDLSMHLIVCTGRNTELKDQLLKLPVASSNSLCVIPFTDKISDLMAISDLIITKAGPCSIIESMALRVPLLIDATGACLNWEKANIDFVRDAKVGEEIKNFNNLEPLLKKYLNDSQTRQEIQKAYDSVPQNQFHEKIVPIVNQMISTARP